MDNRTQIEREAQRRANVMGKSYGVYQHQVEGYCIHRPMDAEHPSKGFWLLTDVFVPKEVAA